jgi:glycosyltransferase involved in cell wall biosynthesis
MKVVFLTRRMNLKIPEAHNKIAMNMINALNLTNKGNMEILNLMTPHISGWRYSPYILPYFIDPLSLYVTLFRSFISFRKSKVIFHIINLPEFFGINKLLNQDLFKIVYTVFYPYEYLRTQPKIVSLFRLQVNKTSLVDKIICFNNDTYSYLLKKGIERKKIIKLFPPVDTQLFHPIFEKYRGKIRQDMNIPQSKKVILFIGSLVPERGVFLLIDVLNQLRKKLNNLILIIAYPENENDKIFLPKVIRAIKLLQLQDHVLLLGKQKDIRKIYSISDMVVLPFLRTYWITDPPLVLLESLSMGKIVITTPFGEARYLIKNMENGILIEPFIDSYVNMMYNILTDPDEYQDIARNARTTAIEKFSLTTIGREIYEIYATI